MKFAPRPFLNSGRSRAAAKAILPSGTSGWRQAHCGIWLRKDGKRETFSIAGDRQLPDSPGEARGTDPRDAAQLHPTALDGGTVGGAAPPNLRGPDVFTGIGPASFSFHSRKAA